MRVLRSHYMKLQESYILTTTTLTTNQQLASTRTSTSSLSAPAASACQTNVQQKQHSSSKAKCEIKKTTDNQGTLCNSFKIPTDAIRISAKPLQPMRRKTMTDLQQPPKPNNFNIRLLNTQGQTGVVKIVLHFYKESPQWYTDLCRSYEGEIWKRLPRPAPTKSSKWLYQCNLCARNLCCFTRMKSHLNIHLGLRPHRCGDCIKKYPSRQSLYRHHKQTKHEMQSPTVAKTQPTAVNCSA